jgi:hypothetical protein
MQKLVVKKSTQSSCSCSDSSSSKTCCVQKTDQLKHDDPNPVTDRSITPPGNIPQVSTSLTFTDTLGSWKARFGINRMNYKINPGLYYVGTPDSNSPVLVTANYKLSFDSLRKELTDLSAWILVLDTKGINVWCAAGKGTFGTDEIVNRLKTVKLSDIVSHRTIILPQLGAPGVMAHEVQKQSGFKVIYGPVRAKDIKAFISSGMKATTDMRTVRFTLWDRLVLTPIELIGTINKSLIIFGVLFILNSIGFGSYGFTDLYSYLGAIFIGGVITPVLLPWIPGRAFAFKGWLPSLLWSIAVNFINGWPDTPSYGWIKAIAYLLILPAVSSYIAMNFTGCSTYTSLSGVKKEMKIAVPLLIVSIGLGVILLIADSIIKIIN